ncbi:MAG: LytTR family DNA-binding domain-containing protein [Eubacteriales bacterium]
MLKIAICDDERIYIKLIEKLARKYFESKEIECEISQYLDAKELLEKEKIEAYDLIFLDIQMGDVSGFEIARELEIQTKSALVFVSSHDELVFESLTFHPFQFIRKSKIEEEFEAVMDDFLKKFIVCSKMYELPVKLGKYPIDINDIIYFEVQNHMVWCHTIREKITLRTTLSTIMQDLAKDGFVQTHKSFYVNINYIYAIEKAEVLLHLNASEQEFLKIPLGRTKRQEVKDMLLKKMR